MTETANKLYAAALDVLREPALRSSPRALSPSGGLRCSRGPSHRGTDGSRSGRRGQVRRDVPPQDAPRVMAKIEEFAAGRADMVLLANRRQTRRWLRKVTAEQS